MFPATFPAHAVMMSNAPRSSNTRTVGEWSDHPDEVRFTGHLKKTAWESEDFLKVPAYPEYVNELGHVEAGHVLKLIDIGGSIPAKKHLGENNVVVTASVDRTNFINPIRRWEIIVLKSRLTRAWKTSMESQVEVSAWNFYTNKIRPIATAHLVFVALDAKRNKTQVPELVPTNYKDFQLAKAADLRKENRIIEGREAPTIPINPEEDAPSVLEQAMTPNDSNALNNVFGGVILDIIDKAGKQAAKKQALGGTVVGVRLDRMSFLEPAFIGETIQAKAIVTKTWNTSMEVQVEVDAVNPANDKKRRIAQCYVVYVALGPDGQKVAVPTWVPQTEAQVKRAESADLRRKTREMEEDLTKKALESPASLPVRLKWWLISLYYGLKKNLSGSSR